MVSVFSLKLDSSFNEDSYQYLIKKVSKARREKFLKYRNREDAYRSLFAEFLARYLAIQTLNISNDDLVISHSSHGKPYFADVENFHFNLSHSGCWIVCAVSTCPVGIDVEKVKPIDRRLMANYFSIEEQASLYRQKAEGQAAYFYELWTLKESFIKQSGVGLSKELNTFSIKLTDKITLENDEKIPNPVFFKQYNIDPNYKIAVCAETNDFAEIVPLTLSQITAVF